MQSRVWRLALVVVLIVAVLLCALPMGVAAGRRFWDQIPVPDFSYDTCGFTLQWHEEENRHYVKYFFDKEGNFLKSIVNGSLKGTITRVGTGQSIKANITEVAIYRFDENGSLIVDQVGQQWWDFGRSQPIGFEGFPKVGMYDGHMVARLDPDTLEPLEILDWQGHVTDLCAQFPDPQ